LQGEEKNDCLLAIVTLMMEAASTFETSVNFYQTTRRNNPEDSHLCTRRRENLKSHGGREIRYALFTFALVCTHLKNQTAFTPKPAKCGVRDEAPN
jgi:hypothetical protein